MHFQEILHIIDHNQEKIATYGKFDDSTLRKINYKLRLDWNYFSNRMEGGTLTKAETRSVMVGNIDVKGKPLKDVMEMNGHDQIILQVLKMSKGDIRISEKRIKEIHQSIMHEDDQSKKSLIGQWKQVPNEIIGYKNEKISFVDPANVAEEVHQLLNRTNAELDKYFTNKKSIHPVEIAAKFHIDFVSIHPFYDGNGRTTRILTNIILMSCGFPAIIIKEEHKQAYYQFLADIQAYGGKEDLFYTFIAERIIETQQLILDALEGKNIEEPDDIDKEILLLKRELEAKEEVGSIKKSNEVIAALYHNHLKYFVDHLIEKNKQLDDLFSENSYHRMINNGSSGDIDHSKEDYILRELNANSLHDRFDRGINSFGIGMHHKGFKKDGLNLFDVHQTVYITFEDYVYHIGFTNKSLAKFLYTYTPSQEELNNIVSEIIKVQLDEIRNKMNSTK